MSTPRESVAAASFSCGIRVVKKTKFAFVSVCSSSNHLVQRAKSHAPGQRPFGFAPPDRHLARLQKQRRYSNGLKTQHRLHPASLEHQREHEVRAHNLSVTLPVRE